MALLLASLVDHRVSAVTNMLLFSRRGYVTNVAFFQPNAAPSIPRILLAQQAIVHVGSLSTGCSIGPLELL